jgi:Mg-chelatase subunit ChlD
VAVLMASDTVAPLIPAPTRDLSLARRAIADAPITDRSSDLLPAVRAACEVLAAVRGAKEIDVITDGQRSAWSHLDDVIAVLRAAPDVAVRVVVVGPEVRGNVGVSALRPAGDLAPAGRPLRFEATVTNYGTTPVTGLPVRLRIDADAAPVAEAVVDQLPPGESRTVALYARLGTPGPHAVTAAVPADHLPADDRRTVVVRAVGRLRVLLVDGDTSGRSDRSAAAFLRAALQPVPAEQRDAYFLQVTTITPTALATTRLDDFAAVVLAGPTSVGDPAALAAYVRGGGGLIVFPDRPTADGDPLVQLHLLPAALGPAHGDADHPLPLSAGPFDHPIAALWNDAANGSPAAAHVYRAFTLTPDANTTADAGAPRAVLRLADGSPFAMERPFGQGRSILFAIPADTVASDLPDRGGLFVPLVYRCLAAIVGRADEPLNVSVGQPLLGPAVVADVGRPVAVRTPTGTGDTTVTLAGDVAGFRYDATDRAGPYAAAVGDRTTLFAAQMDPAESRLDTITATNRAALSAVATISDATTPGSGPIAVAGRAAGGTLAVPLLLVALALAVAEPFVANGFSRSR